MGRHKVQNTPAIRRMPTYLHKLMQMHVGGEEYASTSKLAEYINADPIIVRKDFELTGLKGFPGVGYKTDDLIAAIQRFLGWNEPRKVCLVGAGSLGSALLGYEEFSEYGMKIIDVFDADPLKIGTHIHGHAVHDIREMAKRIAQNKPEIAIICVNTSCAQMVVDALIECGVKAFWNFANICLQVPPDVLVQREVIAGGFALLSMKLKTHGPGKAEDEVEPE
ncbi:MAG: redox-sensing transcriptional repressor Rex [Victivallaceae bacterium]|nr:redox-sensing transcriptional repressor Rex [Victivallaceae bacterium]